MRRAAGDVTHNVGSQISTAATAPFPDFAFEQNGAQNTLSQTAKGGPVLLVLFGKNVPRERLAQLTQSEASLASAGLHIIAAGVDASKAKIPLSVDVSDDVRAVLGLFQSRDGGETELMLDRGANVRARWTSSGASGLAPVATLLSDAVRVNKIPVAAANHAGHAH